MGENGPRVGSVRRLRGMICDANHRRSFRVHALPRLRSAWPVEEPPVQPPGTAFDSCGETRRTQRRCASPPWTWTETQPSSKAQPVVGALGCWLGRTGDGPGGRCHHIASPMRSRHRPSCRRFDQLASSSVQEGCRAVPPVLAAGGWAAESTVSVGKQVQRIQCLCEEALSHDLTCSHFCVRRFGKPAWRPTKTGEAAG